MSTFKAVLGPHEQVARLKSGELQLKTGTLEFEEIAPTHHAFKPMIANQPFDFCEMAITTLILAKAYGRPIHMLPTVMIGRLQQPFAAVNAKVKMDGPADLAGKTIGVRSFAQTTVTWIRGILKCDHNASFDGVKWVKFEDGHVPEAADPAVQAPAGRKMKEMLVAGDIDIAIGQRSDVPETRPLFGPDPDMMAAEWLAKHGCYTINHIVAVPERMVANHLDTIVDFYTLLKKNKASAAQTPNGIDPKPYGFVPNLSALNLLIEYMNALDMMPKPIALDDLIDPRLQEAIGE